ncbi:MAG: hypothetical protein QOE45_2446 [Frankiaceae bacterium]|jgi:hypothetical protein|nr:hypothetical protein [Frankiaceae bacterium]
MAEAGRSLWAALHLLDRQVVDRDGVPCAKVDDLDFVEAEEPGGLPILTDILCGQAALAHRLDRRRSRAVELLRRVIRPVPEPGPARISFGTVTEIGTDVTVSLRRTDLEVSVVEEWLGRHVLSHVPGSGIRRERR